MPLHQYRVHQACKELQNRQAERKNIVAQRVADWLKKIKKPKPKASTKKK